MVIFSYSFERESVWSRVACSDLASQSGVFSRPSALRSESVTSVSFGSVIFGWASQPDCMKPSVLEQKLAVVQQIPEDVLDRVSLRDVFRFEVRQQYGAFFGRWKPRECGEAKFIDDRLVRFR